MLNRRALVAGTLLGTAMQLTMVLLGHSTASIANLFAVGGMGISLVTGAAYALFARREAASASPVLGGVIAGGVCALIGIALSFLLGDVPAAVLAFGTLSSAVTGALGGWIGRFLTGRGSAGAAALLCLLAPTVHAQSAAPAPATTRDFAWLAGRWQGRMSSGGRGVADVTFAPPAGGVITGVMRLVDHDTVLVVELISLVDTPNGVEMRFRHFSPSLQAYEPTFKQAMRLSTHTPDRAVFENTVAFDKSLMSTQPRVTTFQRVGQDSFVGKSAIIGADGKSGVVVVTYRRIP